MPAIVTYIFLSYLCTAYDFRAARHLPALAASFICIFLITDFCCVFEHSSTCLKSLNPLDSSFCLYCSLALSSSLYLALTALRLRLRALKMNWHRCRYLNLRESANSTSCFCFYWLYLTQALNVFWYSIFILIDWHLCSIARLDEHCLILNIAYSFRFIAAFSTAANIIEHLSLTS